MGDLTSIVQDYSAVIIPNVNITRLVDQSIEKILLFPLHNDGLVPRKPTKALSNNTIDKFAPLRQRRHSSSAVRKGATPSASPKSEFVVSECACYWYVYTLLERSSSSHAQSR